MTKCWQNHIGQKTHNMYNGAHYKQDIYNVLQYIVYNERTI